MYLIFNILAGVLVESKQPRRIAPILRFLAGIIVVSAVTMFIFWLVMRPPLDEVRAMLFFLSITALISMFVGYGAYRLGWFSRSPRLMWTLLSGYALSSGLTFLNVWFTAQLMFLNAHDLTLATILLIFATGIAISLGYFVSTAITDDIDQLNQGARQVARGNLQTRIPVNGRDEMADLAHSFNQMAIQLEDSAKKQKESEKLRRDLVAWIGHDLRTPLASVRAIVEALSDNMIDDPVNVERYLTSAKMNIASLSNLLDELFEMAQIDAGGMRLNVQPNSLSDLVSDTLESFSERAHDRGILLEGHVEPATDPVMFDAQQIGRVLGNLVENAIRYSPAGTRVQIKAKRIKDHVVLAVQDTGDGIDAEDLPHIFEQFYRGEKSRNRATGGSGLGLAISKAIVESHRGRLDVQSERGKGTIFQLLLPQRTFSKPAHPFL